jgi:hypothetical protein
MIASNTEYLLFIIPRRGWNASWECQDDKKVAESRTETDYLVLCEVEDNRRANRELSRNWTPRRNRGVERNVAITPVIVLFIRFG